MATTIRRRCAAAALVALARCVTDDEEAEPPPGTLMGIQVQSSDPVAQRDADGFTLRVSVADGTLGHSLTGEVRFGREDARLRPAEPQLVLTPRSRAHADEALLIETTLLRGGAPWVTQRARVQYAPGLPTVLYVDMNSACATAPPCPAGETCGGDGRCVDVRRPLVLWGGRGSPAPQDDRDAAAPDVSSSDAGVDVAPPTDAACDGPSCGDTTLAGIAAGGDTTCVWTNAGAVSCWGAALWDATDPTATPAPAPRPVRVPALDGARSIAMGASLCAVASSGGARCFPEAVPARFRWLTGVRAVAVGRDHACALLEGGAARCAGANESGQCGDGLTETPLAQPRPVEGLARADDVIARGDVSCALRAGALLCWGAGHGVSAAEVAGLTDVRRADVFAAADPTAPTLGCAVNGRGEVRCWGRPDLVGLGPATDPIPVPPGAAIAGLDAVDVRVGEGFACALTRAGGVSCWGLAEGCRLGRPGAPGEVAGRPVALPVSGARALAVGARHACAVVGPSRVVCWGDASSGQLGHGALRAPDTCAPVAAEVAP